MPLKDRFKKESLTQSENIQESDIKDVETTLLASFTTKKEAEHKEYGPLDLLMADSKVSEIFINGAKNVFVKKEGITAKSNLYFKDNNHLKSAVNSLLEKSGINADGKTILNNVKLFNGLIIDVIFQTEPIISIKRIKRSSDTMESLLQEGFLTKEISETLLAAIKTGLNILITGDKNTGKTALLNALSSEIPKDERIAIIDDTDELSLNQTQTIKLASNNSVEAELLMNSLSKLKPNRIILDNCNSRNVCLFKNTNINGLLISLCTNNDSLKTMSALLTGYNLSNEAAKYLVASTINLLIKVEKIKGETNKITSISEVSYEDDITLTPIFTFKKSVRNSTGTYVSSGIKPDFIKDLKDKDLSIPLSYFNKEREHTYSNKKLQPAKAQTKKSALKARFVSANNDFTD